MKNIEPLLICKTCYSSYELILTTCEHISNLVKCKEVVQHNVDVADKTDKKTSQYVWYRLSCRCITVDTDLGFFQVFLLYW